jgi:type IV secretion system protein VirD4
MFFGTWFTTQYVAAKLGYQEALGKPLFYIFGLPIYYPIQWFAWAYHYDAYAPTIFNHALYLQYASFFMMFFLMIILAIRRAKRNKNTTSTYGSARWATTEEVEKAGLCPDYGVILAQSNDALYISELNEKQEIAWLMKRPGDQLIRHNGPEHLLCFAPTRSGKGVGLVIPTLLSWTDSVLVYDIKKELWHTTAGWRRQFSHCLRFEPTAPDSVRFNPLMEIRMGIEEVKDVQNIADILVDPDGSAERKDHWEKTGHALLVGVIIHVMYAEKDKTLSGVASFLSNPERSIEDTFLYMMQYPHYPDGTTHHIVAECAREMLNKSGNEISGVVSTAMSFLSLYRDPIIRSNTAESDFRIHQIMNSERPVSLYLVVPPSDIDRTKPLMRLLLNQFGRRLTEKLDTKRQYKHRLLIMLDEFPSLGRLGFFETELAFLAGYGVKCFLIAQSLNQIEKSYGPNNSILDNTQVKITYGANDDHTAKRISDLLGQATEIRAQKNLAGGRLSPWLGHVMVAEQESPRPLLTPGEILQLPGDDAIILSGNMPPYRAKKIMYYQDARFKDRANMPPPDRPEEQEKELIREEITNMWPTVSNDQITSEPIKTATNTINTDGGKSPMDNEKHFDLENEMLQERTKQIEQEEQIRDDELQEEQQEREQQNLQTKNQIINKQQRDMNKNRLFAGEEHDLPI